MLRQIPSEEYPDEHWTCGLKQLRKTRVFTFMLRFFTVKRETSVLSRMCLYFLEKVYGRYFKVIITAVNGASYTDPGNS